MNAPRYHVVLNVNAGTANALSISGEALALLFEKYGMDAIIDADGQKQFSDRVRRALESEAQVIVAAGGDGTITALASALVGTDKSLAILPLGTVNALARDLHLPLDVESAVAALGDLEPRRIDVGEVNGRIFLHKVVIGLIPAMAAGREHIRGRADLAAKIGFIRYFFRRLARARRMAVSIETDQGERHVERVQAIAVSSNAYDEAFGRFFSRERFDQGTLTLYVLKHLTFSDFFRLSAEMFIGRWHQDEALAIESVQAVTVDSRKKRLKVMFDGDVETLATPLNFRIQPLALSILAPKQEIVAEPTEPASILGGLLP